MRILFIDFKIWLLFKAFFSLALLFRWRKFFLFRRWLFDLTNSTLVGIWGSASLSGKCKFCTWSRTKNRLRAVGQKVAGRWWSPVHVHYQPAEARTKGRIPTTRTVSFSAFLLLAFFCGTHLTHATCWTKGTHAKTLSHSLSSIIEM